MGGSGRPSADRGGPISSTCGTLNISSPECQILYTANSSTYILLYDQSLARLRQTISFNRLQFVSEATIVQKAHNSTVFLKIFCQIQQNDDIHHWTSENIRAIVGETVQSSERIQIPT